MKYYGVPLIATRPNPKTLKNSKEAQTITGKLRLGLAARGLLTL